MITRLLLYALLAFTCVPASYALEPPKRPTGYVHDQAGMMSATARKRLETYLRMIEQKTTNQIVVAIFPSLEGGALEDFSMRLAEAWKVGQKGKDNGVILLIFKDDRKVRIEVGYGLEGSLPDARAGQIIAQVITPAFKQGRFEEGIFGAVAAILQATSEEFQTPVGTGSVPGRPARNPEAERAFLIFILGAAAVISVIDLFRYGAYRAGHGSYAGRFGFLEWWFRFALLLFILNLLFRVAFYSMLFSRGGYHGSRGGFGGFSGGGGSFGGGGASGGW